jgi:hypothetical protein
MLLPTEQWDKCHSTFLDGCESQRPIKYPTFNSPGWQRTQDHAACSGCGNQVLIPTPAYAPNKVALLRKIHTSLALSAAMGLSEIYFPRILGLRITCASPLSCAGLCQRSICHVVCRWAATPLSRMPWHITWWCMRWNSNSCCAIRGCWGKQGVSECWI